MTHEEVAPPFESWPEHLKDLGDKELTELAGDYWWLTEENKPEDQRAEFNKRREAIIAECERRGIRPNRPDQENRPTRSFEAESRKQGG